MALPAAAAAVLHSRWSSGSLWQGGALYNLFTITKRHSSSNSSKEDVLASSKYWCLSMGKRRRRRTDHFIVRSTPQPQQEDGKTVERDVSVLSSQEDLKFLLKLTLGSVGGAFLIKYGSILFPAITRPNILQALLFIIIPMLASIYLLLKQSRIESQRQDPL